MTWNAYAQVYSAQVDPYLVSMANQINLRTVAATDAEHVLYGGSYGTNFYTNPLYPFVRKLYHAPNRFSARFFYDALGRLVVSQNARQYNAPERKFSYTRYDALGRVVEVGEKTDPATGTGLRFKQIFGAMVSGTYNPTVISETKLISWIENNDGERREVTKSYYDEPLITQVPVTFDPHTQRKRITHVTYEELYDDNDQTYDHASHFVYDIHGNVKTLVQDNRKMAVEFASLANQRFKRMDYTYDLVSGNVHRMSVTSVDTSGILQPADQWHHAYRYDADNRIVEVFTSRHTPLLNGGWSNAMLENELTENPDWHKDAHYVYYDHGPLARVELGKDQLQGLDYVYNLQGWLKGVNATSLTNTLDPGKDGVTTGANPVNGNFAKDVFAFSLHYHQGDYTPIAATVPAATINSGSHAAANSSDLYNGNIRFMQTTLTNPTTREAMPMLNAYRYDQLNRLAQSRSYENGFSANEWNPTSYANNYFNAFTFDAMGNILTQKRHKRDGTQIEDMTYRYKYDVNNKLLRNRLYHVNDAIASNVDDTDIDDMGAFVSNPLLIETANNYSYDEEGRLIKDTQEGIERITWRVDGKVKSIERPLNSGKKNVSFDYNAFGNRIAKHVFDDDWNLEKSTYYILDAQGNQLSMYEHVVDENEATVNYTLSERNIYGSSRLGKNNQRVDVFATYTENSSNTVLGETFYELSNHLGNVLTVINDIKIPLSDDNETVSEYQAGIVSISDYSPFGVQLDGRTVSASSYRYGFNGMEKDDEVFGSEGTSYTTEYRQYDSRIGRWTSRDPLFANFPWQSPYVAFDNNPIYYNDPMGLSSENTTNNPPVENLSEHITTLVNKGSELLSKLNINHEYSVKSDMIFNENGDVIGWEGQVNYYNGDGEVMMSYKFSLSLDDKSQQDKKLIPEFPSEMMKILDVTFPVLETALLSTAQTQFRYAHNPGSNLSLPTGDLKAYQQGAKIVGQLATVVVVSDELIKGVNALYNREYHQAAKHGNTAAGYTAAAIMMASPTGVTQIVGAALFVATWLYSTYYEAPRVGQSTISNGPINRRSGGGNGHHPCFVAGTLVSTPSGFIQIENLNIGDTVFSYNLVKKTIEKNVVYGNSKRISNALYFLEIGGNEVRVTEEHPFYILNKKWVKVKDLQVGDSVLNQDGSFMMINYIEKIKDSSIVYNLKISDNKNYFVTPVKLLVHNKDCFAKGSLILLPDGKYLPIEKLNQNDSVASYDVCTNEIKQTKVVKVIEVYHHKIVELTLENGQKVILTQDHPVMGSDNKWKSFNPTETLCKTGIETLCYQTGDKIKLVNFNEDSNSVVEENFITNIESKNEVHKMYNLVLEDGNTYIVDGIVVSTENSTVVNSFIYFQLYIP